MNRLRKFGVPALFCAAGLLVGAAVAQEGGGAVAMGIPAWKVKGKEHEELKNLVGTWDAQVMAGGAVIGPGKATSELILEGNFLEQRYKGQMGPMPFDGRLILGYDTLDKEWVAIWIDSTGPLFSISRGTEKDGVVTFQTNDPSMTDPSGKRVAGKMTIAWTSDTSYTLTMFEGDAEMMKIVYTKK